MVMTRVAASKVLEQLPEMLDRVAKSGERIVLCRKGKDVGAIVSVRDLRLLRRIEDHLDNQAADRALREGGRVPWKVVKKRLGLE